LVSGEYLFIFVYYPLHQKAVFNLLILHLTELIMTKRLRSILHFLFFVTCFIYNSTYAQNVSVLGAALGDGTYADLRTAFTAINSGAQTGATITISITGNTTESATAILNANDWKSLSITPSGAHSISGNLSNGLIHLSGAANVLIDGLNSGGNSLTLDNMAIDSTSTILFNNDCKNITVKNCSILGSASAATSGTVFFGMSAFAGTGNDGIKIKSCAIDASISGNPINGIYSKGSVIAGQENSADSIQNSSIANFYNTLLASSGVMIGAGNTDWTISGCRFYQTATCTYFADNTHTVIKVLSGNGYSVTDNIIGYATAAGTGVYTMGGSVNTRFIAIDLSVGTTVASSVQGNTITAINLSTSSSVFVDYGVLCGIRANTGNINIGNNNPNIIGGSTSVDHIVLKPSVTLGAIVGINSASTGTILIKNNIIGGLTSSNSIATIGGSVYGIIVSGVAASMTISDNIIGNSTPDNMHSGILGVTTANSYAAGIYCSTTPATTSITKNKIQNISAYGSNTGSYVRGIFTATGTSNSSPVTVSGNTVVKLTSNSTLPSPLSAQTAAGGITVSIGTNDVIADNIISDIALINNTVATNSYAVGISHANGANTIIRNNKISGITNASTAVSITAPGVAAGILIRSGATATAVNVINNMISLGTASTSNTAFVGIMANHGATPDPFDNVYYNTVNITGTAAAGAQPSFCFLRGDFSTTARTHTVNIKNNIFTNNRTGGTGSHFAIGNNYGAATSSSTGWGAKVSNNNILNANAATVGWWTSAKTFADWKIASVCDSASFSGYTVTYVDPASDLHLNMGGIPNVMESKGQTIGTVTTDIDNELRPGPAGSVNGGALAPDIGADEFDGVIQDLIPPTITYTLLLPACDALDRKLIATIADAGTLPTSGPLQPRVYYRKNKGTWVSAQGALTTGTASNGTWTFTLLTADMGGLVTNDSVFYFVIAQDISGVVASNPSAGVIAANVNTVSAYPILPNAYALNALPTITSTVPAAICDSGKVTLSATASAGDINWYTAVSGGSSLHTGAVYTTPLIKATTPYYIDAMYNGCTSSVRTMITATVNHSTASTSTTSACDSLKWNSTVYKASGTYLDTIPNKKGCDSIMTLVLTIKHHSVSTQTIKACDRYLWNGTMYTASGVYLDTIHNNVGCDSLMKLNLTINNTTTSSQLHTACDTYTWQSKTYTTSGVYKDTLINSKGCDSILSLDLTINNSTSSFQLHTACDTYTWQGKTYTTSGIYKDTISNAKGCDSILNLNLTINYGFSSTKPSTVCDSLIWNGIKYTKSGTYTQTFKNKAGCDSSLTLILTVAHANATVKVNNNTITADSVAVIYKWLACSNNNAVIAGATGQSYTAASNGSYAVVLITKDGCMDTSICVPIIVTGISEAERNIVRLYPNPGNGLYTLLLPEQAQIKIVSLTGAVVFDQRLSKGDHALDLLNITNGVYLVQIYTNETVSVLKLIKQE
jgi:hypothetical protein